MEPVPLAKNEELLEYLCKRYRRRLGLSEWDDVESDIKKILKDIDKYQNL